MKEKWRREWSRGLKILKAVGYSISAGKPLEDFFGRGVYNWLYLSRKESADICVKDSEFKLFKEFARKKFKEDMNFHKFILNGFEEMYTPHLNYLKSLQKNNLSSLSSEELATLFKEYRKSLNDYYVPMWLVVITEDVIEFTLYDVLKKYFDTDEIEEKASKVSALTKSNFVADEEYALYKISLLSEKEQEEALKKHAKKYEYIPMYDYDYDPHSFDYFKKRLKEFNSSEEARKKVLVKQKEFKENEKEFEKLLKYDGFTEEDVLKLRSLHYLINHKDQRSYYRSMDSYLGRKLYFEIARRTGFSVGDLMFLTYDETESLIINPDKKIDYGSRKEGYAFAFSSGKIEIFVGKDMEDYIKENVNLGVKGELKGLGVSKSVSKGRVKIVLHSADLSKIKDGDVLVTPMTRPEYVLMMKRCSGIVTDEGGMLCHAAIVSRELGIPCVVGTKHATEILHDGDLVEVDADHGVIRRLK